MGATAARTTPEGSRLTVEEFRALSVEGDRKQLVEGEIVVTEPKAMHARLQSRLHLALASWTQAGKDRGEVFFPTDVRLDEHNVYGPDLLWFSEGGLRAAFPSGFDAYPERLPDLCVEVRSEGTWRYDIGAKKRVYEAAGLPELWLVDHTSESVLVYRRSTSDSKVFDVALELGRGEALTSSQLPGFSLAVEELFAG